MGIPFVRYNENIVFVEYNIPESTFKKVFLFTKVGILLCDHVCPNNVAVNIILCNKKAGEQI